MPTPDRNEGFHDAVRLAVVDAFSNPIVQTVLRETSYGAAKTAIRDQMLTIGIDMNRPGEVAKDMTHLREWRLLVKLGKTTVWKAVFVVLSGALLSIVGLGFKDYVVNWLTHPSAIITPHH